VAELLSGLPLQQISQTDDRGQPTNGAVRNGTAVDSPHRPHAQTGSTPLLHP
jgi:dTMP kinase